MNDCFTILIRWEYDWPLDEFTGLSLIRGLKLSHIPNNTQTNRSIYQSFWDTWTPWLVLHHENMKNWLDFKTKKKQKIVFCMYLDIGTSMNIKIKWLLKGYAFDSSSIQTYNLYQMPFQLDIIVRTLIQLLFTFSLAPKPKNDPPHSYSLNLQLTVLLV